MPSSAPLKKLKRHPIYWLPYRLRRRHSVKQSDFIQSPLKVSMSFEHCNAGPDVIRNTTRRYQERDSRTVTLFIQVFGDKPVQEITGRIGGEFRDLLFSLPSSYTKGKQEMDLNAEVERAQVFDLPPLSGKSVKNHFMRLSGLWNQLIRREIAEKNPWSNWDFDLTKPNPRRAWIDDELALLSWTCSTISQAIRAVTEQDFPRHRSSHFGNLDGSLDMVPKPVRDRLPIIAVERAGQSEEWLSQAFARAQAL